MRRTHFSAFLLALSIGLPFAGVPCIALADTSAVLPMQAQDLTSLGTLTTTTTGVPDPTFQQMESKYQTEPVTSTTGWVGYCRQAGRQITLSFPNQIDVQHIEITMRQDAAAGIYLPSNVEFDVEEGTSWYKVGSQRPTLSLSAQGDQAETFTFDSNTGVEANAVRVTFPVGVFVFARGFDVTGSQSQQGQYVSWNLNNLVSPSTPDDAALSGANGNDYGIKNMLLVPTGAYGSLGTWTEKDFEPMLGYVNPSGYMDAPLFDTILFTPYSKVPDTVDGWTGYLNDLFAPGQQLSALDAAVANTNQLGTMYRPGYKEKVVLNIPYFPVGNYDFGQVNGQDINFAPTASDPGALVARTAALEWYIKTVLARWNQADFQHLELAGLYWNDEQMTATDPNEVQLVQTAEELAHQNSLPLLWVPYYGANEETDWKSLGFDAAWLQPNFIELGANANVSRIQSAIDTAEQTGMGIEVELTSLDNTDVQLYQTFLQQLESQNFGGSDVSHVFYDGSKLLVQAASSTDPQERSVYDETAEFIMSGTPGMYGN